MPSYQYRDSHVKDKTVSPTVLSLTWESPYLGKSVFILRRGPGGQDRQVITGLSPDHSTFGGNDTVTAPTGAQHITQVAECGLHIKHGAIHIHLSHWSAVDRLSLAMTPGPDVIWVGNQPTNDAIASLVDRQLALRALEGIVAYSTVVDSRGVLAEDIKANA